MWAQLVNSTDRNLSTKTLILSAFWNQSARHLTTYELFYWHVFGAFLRDACSVRTKGKQKTKNKLNGKFACEHPDSEGNSNADCFRRGPETYIRLFLAPVGIPFVNMRNCFAFEGVFMSAITDIVRCHEAVKLKYEDGK